MRSKLSQSPSVLLLSTGTLLGMSFPLAKMAREYGFSPISWAMVISFGAVLTVTPWLWFQGGFRWLNLRILRFVVISGAISFVAPNLLVTTVTPHVGAGFTGLMFALSPLLTTILAVSFGEKKPSLLGLAGIGLGLVGMVVATVARSGMSDAPGLVWLLWSLSIPLFLAAGNVYRSLDWPDGVSADVLAFWSHSFSILIFALWVEVSGSEGLDTGLFRKASWLVGTQFLVSGLTFPLYFRLQKHGGPILLSQIGYVGAVVGMLIATGVLGEHYPRVAWGGFAIVFLGIMLSVFSKRGQSSIHAIDKEGNRGGNSSKRNRYNKRSSRPHARQRREVSSQF